MAAQYFFDELEPATFQRLINALLIARYGDGIRLLPLRGKDGGRDAETAPESHFFTINLGDRDNFRDNSIRPGRYLFQVKHHRLSDRPPATVRGAIVQDFSVELTSNVLTRSQDDHIDYFFLITNVPSSRDAVQRIDERRSALLKLRSGIHADVLWQEHINAWLDQTASVWNAFPEIFAGRIVPYLGQIASESEHGSSHSFRLALQAQYKRDDTIRFQQIGVEQRLPRLFVDLDATPLDFNFRAYEHFAAPQISLFGEADTDQLIARRPKYYFPYGAEQGALELLLSEGNRKLSRIILEGGPGQGKSTITQMLAQICRSLIIAPAADYKAFVGRFKRLRIPVRIELRLFAEWLGTTDRSVEQYVAETFTKDAGGATVTVEAFHAMASKQPILLIFDGLDEVGSDDLRDSVVTKIIECVSRLETDEDSDLRVIVTSRPPAIAGRLDALNGFGRIQVLPLSNEKVKAYVDRWTEVQCTDTAERERVRNSFYKRRNEDHVTALAKNPMQLSVLLHFIRLKGEAFPDRRAELYRDYFKTVIDRDVEKSPELLRHRQEIEALHEVIGFQLHSRAEQNKSAASLTRSEIITIVREWLKSEDKHSRLGEQLFKVGEERLGLIVALSGEGARTQYGFEIQPVREYFTAAYINDKCEGDAHEVFEAMVRRPFWKEVARFLAGLRRVNERADLLSRSRGLDQEPGSGWRSDGALIVHQLVQEGVFSAPGNVHRDALTFLLALLDPTKQSACVVPPELQESLPKLLKACPSQQPIELLASILLENQSNTDFGALHDLWTVAYRSLESETLYAAMCSYNGPPEIRAALKLLWPAYNGRSFAFQLEAAGELEVGDDGLLAKYWYRAGLVDEALRKIESNSRYQSLLLEQFAFYGTKFWVPFLTQSSHFAVWKLCGLLYQTSRAIRGEVEVEDSELGEVDYSGLQREEARALQELIQLLHSVMSAERQSVKRTTRDALARQLVDMMHGDGIMALVASRCATTMIGHIEGPRRVIRGSHTACLNDSGTRLRPNSDAWKTMKSTVFGLFRSVFPSDFDSAGRSLSNRLLSQGFHTDLQSEILIHGKSVSILELLIDPARVSDGWLSRVPVQHFWLRSAIKRETALPILKLLATQEVDWFSSTVALDQRQVQLVGTIVKVSQASEYATAALFALNGSKIWAAIRTKTLAKLLAGDSSIRGRAELVFENSRYPGISLPLALAQAADDILCGRLQVHSSVAHSAAKFASENRSISLPPLRETSAFPK